MTGPDEPWDFPELSAPPADPTSLELPEPGPEPVYDTGSDGWWRAQARAQREAAEQEPAPLLRPLAPVENAPVVMAPLELIEPTVLNDPAYLPTGPSPLEAAYLEPEAVFAPIAFEQPPPHDEWLVQEPVAEVPVAAEPEAEESGAEEPEAGPPVMPPLVAPERAHGWYDGPPHAVAGERVGPRRALAWAALAVAGVGLLVVAFLMLGKDEPQGTPTVSAPSVASVGPTTQATPTAEPTAAAGATPSGALAVTPLASASSKAAPPLAPFVPLTVLNNSRISHLAERAAARFRRGGWPIAGTGNYRGKLVTTTIYYPEGQRGSALRFAKQFGARVLPRPATLPGNGMTVVVTRDFA